MCGYVWVRVAQERPDHTILDKIGKRKKTKTVYEVVRNCCNRVGQRG